MAATSAGKMAAQKILFLGFSSRPGALNSFVNKILPCCSYATFVGKAASSMMRSNRAPNPRGMHSSLTSRPFMLK